MAGLSVSGDEFALHPTSKPEAGCLRHPWRVVAPLWRCLAMAIDPELSPAVGCAERETSRGRDSAAEDRWRVGASSHSGWSMGDISGRRDSHLTKSDSHPRVARLLIARLTRLPDSGIMALYDNLTFWQVHNA